MTHHLQKKGTEISRRTLLRVAVYSTLGVTMSVGYAQSNNLEIIRQNVPIEGLPASLDGFSIGVMADFHAGAWGNRDIISHAVSAMRQLKPDVITLIGDYIDGIKSHRKDNIDNGMFVFHELETLNAPHGVYAVLGNHDYWTDSTRISKLLSERNITLLVDENRTLSNGLILSGVDDYWQNKRRTSQALMGIENTATTILLSHNPDINSELTGTTPVRLVISGHTHGGQIRIPFTNYAPWVPCNPRYRDRTGLFRETQKRWGFISKGIGSFLLPIRLSCPPDIALLQLRSVS